jgi:peptide/nickel transport system substrate-binding protein
MKALATGTLIAGLSLSCLLPCPVSAQDTLRVGEQQEPTTLNPVMGTRAVEGDAYNLLFDGLFRTDDQGNLVPDLATRVPTMRNGDISRDGLTITYHMVRNARWSDGKPVTSDDVKFTFDAIMEPRNNVPGRDPYDRFERVETPDRYRIAVHLKQPYAAAASTAFLTTIQGAIIPAHVLRGAPDFNRDPFGTTPVGSGPYRLASWHHGNDMTFEANPAYHRGAPKIRRIVWLFTPDENSIIAALRAHEVGLVNRLGVAPYSQLREIPAMIPAMGSSLGWEHVAFNTSRGPLQDVRVRRALCEGMDLGEIYSKVAHGIGDLGVGLEHPKGPWYDRSLRPCRFDPVDARALLDQAGWHVGAGGVRRKGGAPLEIVFSTSSGAIDREQTQVILQSRWRDLGVDTQLKNYPPATFFAPAQAGGILFRGKFDVALAVWGIPTLDPGRDSLDTSSSIPPAGANDAFWRNTRVDALEAQGERIYDPTARKEIYDRIQQIEAAEVPFVTMRWWTLIAMHDVQLRGIRLAPTGSIYWNVHNWTY